MAIAGKKWSEENKDHVREISKKYYDENRDNILERGKLWYEENKEARTKTIENWRKNNPEKIKGYKKAWREANPERIRDTRKLWRKNNLEKARQTSKTWNKNNPDKIRGYNLKNHYGLSVDEFDKMVEHQEGLCKVCNKEMDRPFVDHCHTTGKVRALLCIHCNTMLGMAKESLQTLQNAIDYLKFHSLKD